MLGKDSRGDHDDFNATRSNLSVWYLKEEIEGKLIISSGRAFHKRIIRDGKKFSAVFEIAFGLNKILLCPRRL